MSRKRKPNSGNPARPQPIAQVPTVKRLYRLMEDAVKLTGELQDKLPDDAYLNLRAGTLGLMFTYAHMTGLPRPDQYLTPIEGDAAA
ncbi:hypothetical protein SEA_SONALI_66 [Arthrobacter phage Sonali]|uniref:Uncharacterized protein n=1 Tax=Arthrobacter phage Sonali TaxID=2510495 RepID=A0A411CQI4_9CAUD|nr:hypothetical protein HOV09_gp66 [Arthrobacter phage Sonali]QAY16178.1 hypothetical protein SEA_SONALI_66 [Arthrobacter phage Sonali]